MKFFNEIQAFLNAINANLTPSNVVIDGADSYTINNLPQMNPAAILQQDLTPLIGEYRARTIRITTNKPTLFHFKALEYCIIVFNPCTSCNKIYIADFNFTNDLKMLDVLLNKIKDYPYYKDYLYTKQIKLLLDYYK